MSTTHALDPVESYLAEVRDRLSDIAEEERGELLDDVTTHVREVAAEHGGENLRDRLGTPQQFGDDLRSSAGYKPRDTSGPNRFARLTPAVALPQWVPAEEMRRMWPKFAPAWAFGRGVLAALFVLRVFGGYSELVPRLGHSQLLGLGVLTAAGVASYALFDRRAEDEPKRPRQLRVAAEVALAVFGLFFFAAASRPRTVYFDSGSQAPQQDPCLRDSAGRPIGNLFAYDAAGQLIPQVFLVDQAGRPIDNLCPDQVVDNNGEAASTHYVRDVNDSPVYNIFPRAQTRTVPDPLTGQPHTGSAQIPPPAVVFPQIATTTTIAPAATNPTP